MSLRRLEIFALFTLFLTTAYFVFSEEFFQKIPGSSMGPPIAHSHRPMHEIHQRGRILLDKNSTHGQDLWMISSQSYMDIRSRISPMMHIYSFNQHMQFIWKIESRACSLLYLCMNSLCDMRKRGLPHLKNSESVQLFCVLLTTCTIGTLVTTPKTN